jgi:two-component system NtrC family sensor kinase
VSAPPRLSLRAQLALIAAAAGLLSAVLGGAVLVPTVHRVVEDSALAQQAAALNVMATAVADRCLAAPDRPACERREADRLGTASGYAVKLLVESAAPEKPYAQVDRGPPGRWLTLDRRAEDPAGSQASTVIKLGLALVGLGSLLVFLFVYVALVRGVARPAERLLSATERVGSDAPLLAEGGPVLGRLGIAFDRMGARLAEERRKVEAQVAALEAANRSLAEARESAIRQEKLATVGRLAAGVAHEIGNPLAALLGYMQIIRNRPEAKALAAFVEPMEREARRIDRILRDLLDFARPGRKAQAGTAVAAVERTVERTLRLLEPQKRFQGVKVHLAIAAGLPPVAADEHQLGQVLVNLLLNAADAMGGAGEVTVAAELAEAGDGSPRVRMTVRDTGPGIEPEHLPQLFDPFFTTKPPGEGTGLGLSICHSIVESFGGAITAANAPDGGAEFRLDLPVADASLAPAASRE